MKSITFEFDAIPESVNKLYFSRGGRRVLSSAGRKFKQGFIASRGGADPLELMQFETSPGTAYELHLWFYLRPERLYNYTYGTDKRVKSPFKDVDVSNLVKLAEDSIAELMGIRDRNNWTVCAHKRVNQRSDTDKEHMVAYLKPLDLEEDRHSLYFLTGPDSRWASFTDRIAARDQEDE